MHGQARNAFEALCALASAERWCWDIFCTTCGHQNFRHALLAIARGGHPEASSWLVRDNGRPGFLPPGLGPLPGPGAWTPNLQGAVSGVMAQADLAGIAATCRFPDWLGYLGLALLYTRDAEQASGTLTSAWCPQLAALPGISGPTREFLQTRRPAGEGILSWTDLGRLESDLASNRQDPSHSRE